MASPSPRRAVIMKVTVEVMTSSELILKDGAKLATLDLPIGSTVHEAMQALGVTEEASWNAAIEGELVYADTTLDDGAHILVFAPIQGG